MARPRMMATNVTTRKPIPTRSLKDRCFRKVVGLSVVRLVKEFVLNWADILILQNGSLALSAKSKLRPITDIQVWTDAFLVYASIFALAHPTETSGLFKYIHTIRLGANRVNGLGWRDYDIQFRLKKECNPSMSFAIVDQELWLLYMYNSAPSPQHLVNQPQPLKCYNFNYRGACSRQNCLYSHLCILCSQPHPYTMCRNTTRNSLNFRSGNFQSTWRPQSTVKPATNSNRIPLPLHARRQ